MKKIAIVVIALCAAQAFAGSLPFKRGTNCRYLDDYPYTTTQSSGWNQNKAYYYSLTNTFPEIRAKGFDHVRLSIRMEKYYDSANDCLSTSGDYNITNIDLVLNRIIDAGLYVQLLQGYWNFGSNVDDVAAKEKYKRCWQLFAERYQNWSDKLGFELLNEPPMNDDESVTALNNLFKETVAIIRQTNPTRLILWPLPDKSCVGSLDKSQWIQLPEDHSNIALVAHCYAPVKFTHQMFSHVDLDDAARLELRWDLGVLKRFVDKHPDIPVVVNEFGVMQGVSDPEDAYEWISTLRERCESCGVPWAHFEYTDLSEGNKQFAVRGGITGESTWRTNVLDALFPKGWDDKPVTYGQLDLDGFAKKLQVSFTGYAGTETLQDFPVLVKLSTVIDGFSYSDFRLANGGDLRFADSTGKHIPHEIDTWNPNGVSTVWVRVPSLTPTTKIYACYGCDNPPAVAGKDVWDEDYVGVWHLNESNIPMIESSRRGVNFSQRSGQGLTFASPGVVGGSVAFDGSIRSNSLIAVDHDNFDSHSKYTFEVWTKQVKHKLNAGILCKSRDYDVWRSYLITDTTNSATRLSLSRNGDSLPDNSRADLFSAPVDGSWRHQVCSLDTTISGDNVKGYLNGALAGTESVAKGKFYNGAGYLVIGNTMPASWKDTGFNGSIDEVRISKCVRSADWVKATHDTVANANFATYAFGGDEPSPEPQQPTGAFAKEVSVAFAGYAGGSTLADFPVLVRLSENIPGFSYADFQLENGGDLRFFDADGNLLSHEIDTWNPNGVSTAWVKVPSLNAATAIVACYGCANPPAVNPKDVWSNGYVGVWHLGESALPMKESSGESVDFNESKGASMGYAQAGVVGGSVDFNGLNGGTGGLRAPDSDSLDGFAACTFEMWTWQKRHDAAKQRFLLAKRVSYNSDISYNIYDSFDKDYTTNKVACGIASDQGTGTSSDVWASLPASATPELGSWNMVAHVYDSAAGRVMAYLNGMSKTNAKCAKGVVRAGAGKLVLGNQALASDYAFPGKIDEVRISNVARSADWIKATHDTVMDPDFATYTTSAGTLSGYAAWMNVKELVGKPEATSAKDIVNAVRYAFDIDPAKGADEIGEPIIKMVHDADGKPAVKLRSLAEGRSDVAVGVLASEDLSDWSKATVVPMEEFSEEGLWKPASNRKSGAVPSQMFFRYTVDVK